MTSTAPKKASQEDWHPADILAALHKRGITLKALAKTHGLTDATSLSAAMIYSRPTNEKRIAEALDVHPKVIWPSRYNEDGSAKKRGIRGLKSTPISSQHNGNNAVGA